MNEKEALYTLINYNLWRRDDNIPNKYEMPNPTEIGKAIDIAIKVLSEEVLHKESESNQND